MVKNKRLKIFPIMTCLVLISCKYVDDTYKYKPITFKSSLDLNIFSSESKNGLVLNDEYYYSGGNYIQNNTKFPNWLLDKKYTIDLYNPILKDSLLSFDIWDIKTPYKLFKTPNSNILCLIKNNDTLKFVIKNN